MLIPMALLGWNAIQWLLDDNHWFSDNCKPTPMRWVSIKMSLTALFYMKWVHILGVGTLDTDFIIKDKQYGNIFKVPNSQAVKQYNQIYGANVDFLTYE